MHMRSALNSTKVLTQNKVVPVFICFSFAGQVRQEFEDHEYQSLTHCSDGKGQRQARLVKQH